MATDFDSKRDKNFLTPNGYTLHIFGRVLKHYFKKSQPQNRATEFFGLAPCNYAESKKIYTVAVEHIEVPLAFVKKHNGAGFFRIKLIQSIFEQRIIDDPNQLPAR